MWFTGVCIINDYIFFVMSLTFAFDSLLFQAASGANVFTYFAQSNFAGKVVIFILALFSIVAWTVMLGKYLDLSKLRSQNQRYERLLSKESHLIALDPSRPKQYRVGRGRVPPLRSNQVLPSSIHSG